MEVKTKMKLRPKRRRRFNTGRSHGDSGKKPGLLLIPVIAAVAALTFSVVLGIYLGKRADIPDTDDAEPGNNGPSYVGEVVPTEIIFASFATPESLATEKDINDVADALILGGFDTLSVSIQGNDGDADFISEVRRTMYPDMPDASDAYNLELVTSVMAERGIRVEGIFVCTHSGLDGAARDARAAYEVALMKEACAKGVRGITVKGLTLDVDGDPFETSQPELEAAVKLLSRLREDVAHTGAVINAAVPLQTVADAEKGGFDIFPYLARGADGVCIDFSAGLVSDTEDGEPVGADYFEYLNLFNIRYYVERYSVRILVPRDRAFNAQGLYEAGYKNVCVTDLAQIGGQ